LVRYRILVVQEFGSLGLLGMVVMPTSRAGYNLPLPLFTPFGLVLRYQEGQKGKETSHTQLDTDYSDLEGPVQAIPDLTIFSIRSIKLVPSP
jgi:hypothetical protein